MSRAGLIKKSPQKHDVRDDLDLSPERAREKITQFDTMKMSLRDSKIKALLLENATKKFSLDVRKGEPSFFKIKVKNPYQY